MFVLMGEAVTISRLRTLWIARLQWHIVAADWSQQHIAQITVTCSRKMRMREAEDRGVFVSISRRPLVALLEGANLGVRGELHHSERRRGPRKGVALRPGADQGIDQLERIGTLCKCT